MKHLPDNILDSALELLEQGVPTSLVLEKFQEYREELEAHLRIVSLLQEEKSKLQPDPKMLQSLLETLAAERAISPRTQDAPKRVLPFRFPNHWLRVALPLGALSLLLLVNINLSRSPEEVEINLQGEALPSQYGAPFGDPMPQNSILQQSLPQEDSSLFMKSAPQNMEQQMPSEETNQSQPTSTQEEEVEAVLNPQKP